MALQDIIAQAIADEIANDPSNVGYAGHTDDEISTMLNSGIPRSATNYWSEQTPISRILNGVGYAPNICASTDVTAAKVMTPVIQSKGVING